MDDGKLIMPMTLHTMKEKNPELYELLYVTN
jgi:hypothetical protein